MYTPMPADKLDVVKNNIFRWMMKSKMNASKNPIGFLQSNGNLSKREGKINDFPLNVPDNFKIPIR